MPTQITICALTGGPDRWLRIALENDGRLVPELLAQKFSQRHIFGIGHTVKAFCRNLAGGAISYDAAIASAGNGALMRIAPVLFPHLRHAEPDLWVDAALASAVTHNDYASIAACVAFVNILSALLVARTPPSTTWWVDEYVRVAEPIERGSC